MNDHLNDSVSHDTLRKRAEAFLARHLRETPDFTPDFAPDEIQRLVHDLSVHQIELELQNEQLRNTQNQLEAARDGYARLYNQAPVGYLTLDASGIIRQCNQTFLDLLGDGNTDWAGRPLADLLTGADREIFLGRFHAFFKNPANKNIDVMLPRGQRGDQFHARLRGRLEIIVPFADRPASQPLLLVSVSDIHQQKIAEDALRDSEQRFRDLSNLASDWFWEQDAQFRFTYFSVGGFLFGGERPILSPAQILGKTRWQLPIDLTPEQWAAHRAILEAHQPFRDFEYPLLLESGESRWLSASGQPLFDAEGQFVGYRGATRDVTERKRLEARLWELATTDPLTGIPNRRCFLDHLKHELTRLSRIQNQPAAVLMLDLDHFKRINDLHGHATGDAMLQHFTALMGAELRKSDTAGRLGGEEFAVLLLGATQDAAWKFAERLRRKVAATPLIHEGQPVPITVSIGITSVTATDTGPLDVLSRADGALYQAKEQGRNRIVVTAG